MVIYFEVEKDYIKLLEQAKSRKNQIKLWFKQIKKQNTKTIDAKFQEEHERAFEKIDCLKCANCCKTTGPLFTGRDIQQLAKHLKLKESVFIEKYLSVDEDRDYVLQTLPCPFLDETTNYCSVYEKRPKACREYPHTDRANQLQIAHLTVKNTKICPAASLVVQNMMEKLPSH